MHGCVINAVATTVLVVEHQAISINIIDGILIAIDKFDATMLHL